MPFFSIAQPFFRLSLIKLFQHSISIRCYCVLFKASRRPFFQRLHLAALFLRKIAHLDRRSNPNLQTTATIAGFVTTVTIVIIANIATIRCN